MAALAALPVDFVVVLQGHDEHGVRVFPEFHEVGHPADDAAVGGFAERRLVDRAVGGDEPVVGPIQFPARVVAVGLGPAFVLRLQHAAGTVAQADQGGEAFADQRAVRRKRRAAIDDGHALAVLRLIDDAIVADEETAFADMPLGRRWRENRRRCVRCDRQMPAIGANLGQAAESLP